MATITCGRVAVKTRQLNSCFDLVMFLLQTFSAAIVTKFSSIDMKASAKKTVQDLKGELKLITASEETWKIWVRLFDAHNQGELVNPDTENTYAEDSKAKVPPLLREFFRFLQGLQESELYRVAQHVLCETPRRSLPYPKIFLKRPKHPKPSCYHIREWSEHRKKKTLAMKELAKELPQYLLTNTEGEIVYDHWRRVKEDYNINGTSMRALVRQASPFLAQRSRKNEKKGAIDDREKELYRFFLDRKKRATFGGIARFCTVDQKCKIGRWDKHASRASVREDRSGCPFALLDFRQIPGAWKQPNEGQPFYEPFFAAFRAFRSPALFEPNVWLWIVDQEKSAAVVTLFHEKMSTGYELYHSTYVPAKTEGMYIMQEAVAGVKNPEAVALMFLTHRNSPSGREPVKAVAAFRRIYSLDVPYPKELYEELIYTINPSWELRLDFYLGVLKTLCMAGDTVYNVFGGTKFMYAALVSFSSPNYAVRQCLRPRGRKH